VCEQGKPVSRHLAEKAKGMNDDRLGVAVIGLGMVAATHARALQDLDSLVAARGVYARESARRAAFADRFGFSVADDPLSLIARDDIDIVLILTPPNAREEYVRAACAARKHVLLEKPIERNSAAAARIVATCAEAGVKLGVTFQHRFREASAALKGYIESGTLGSLAAGQVVVPWWREQSYYDVPGRGTYARDGGGVLISQAIHTLDLLVWLVDLPREAVAMAATTRLHRMEAEDMVAGALRWNSGAVASLIATTAAYPGGADCIVLEFERASARLEAGVLTLRHRDGTVATVGAAGGSGGGADPMAFTHEWHRRAIEDFVLAVREGREPNVSGASALKVHRLIDALLASAAQGRQTTVQDGELE
jgi:UDP-N-acetyl-2-amino-2-deoxyglucuronate dehydrogenase